MKTRMRLNLRHTYGDNRSLHTGTREKGAILERSARGLGSGMQQAGPTTLQQCNKAGAAATDARIPEQSDNAATTQRHRIEKCVTNGKRMLLWQLCQCH